MKKRVNDVNGSNGRGSRVSISLRSSYRYSPSCTLAEKRIDILYNNQADLFQEEPYGLKSIKTFSGQFFEYLTGARVGGYMHNGRVTDMGAERGGIQPDIADYKLESYKEVKSNVTGGQLKLLREQLEKMTLWHLAGYPDKLPKFDWVFYRHNIMRMVARELSEGQFLDEARKSVLYCVQVPFSVPMQLFLHSDRTPNYVKREYHYGNASGNRGYANYHIISISSQFLDHLVTVPQETITALGLNPDDFKIEKRKVKGLKVNGKLIHWFPLLTVEYKDEGYRNWFETEKPLLEEFVASSQVQVSSRLPILSPEDKRFGNGDYLPESQQELTELLNSSQDNTQFPISQITNNGETMPEEDEEWTF
ncbi:MAG TPA: hypothetical protein VI815_01395 [Candidatus Nanoarchaeia archaeon]|nr:hypothetical protein [Candidatus Nanoarchaeia archaeon]